METWSWYNFTLVWLSSLGILTAAYNMSVIGSTLGQPTFFKFLGLTPDSPYTTSITSTANGIFYAGSLVHCLMINFYGDKVGRKKTMYLSLTFLIIGGILQTAMQNLAMYLAGRVITGMGSGALFSTVPVYQSEISPPQSRGFLVGQAGIFSAAGYTMSAWVGYGCYFAAQNGLGSFGFRFPIGVGAGLSAVMAGVAIYLPESPRWLIEHGYEQEAIDLMARLHPGGDAEAREHAARLQATEIKNQHELDMKLRREEGKFGIVTRKANLRRIFFSSFILWSSQAMGILVINNYSVSLYNALGRTGADALLLAAGWITVTVPFNALAPFLIDRLGRKVMFLCGAAVLAISLAGEAAVLSRFSATGDQKYARGGIFFLYLFAFGYGLFIDASSWVYAAEVWPNHNRATGNGIGFAALFLSVIVWTQSAPTGFANIGWKYYMVMVANSVLCFFVVLFFYPETKNLPLEEIPKLFGEHIAMDHIDAVDGDLVSGPDSVGWGATKLQRPNHHPLKTTESNV